MYLTTTWTLTCTNNIYRSSNLIPFHGQCYFGNMKRQRLSESTLLVLCFNRYILH